MYTIYKFYKVMCPINGKKICYFRVQGKGNGSVCEGSADSICTVNEQIRKVLCGIGAHSLNICRILPILFLLGYNH